MEKNKVILIILAVIVLIGLVIVTLKDCSQEDDEMSQPPKLTHENSIEYYVTSSRSHDTLIVTTKKDIYSKFKLLSSTITKDTLPDIGNETVKTEDSTGTEIQKTVPKAYDIYFKAEKK